MTLDDIIREEALAALLHKHNELCPMVQLGFAEVEESIFEDGEPWWFRGAWTDVKKAISELKERDEKAKH